ncbi:hydroxyacylglutathione hydrolase [Granulosicoccus antarcticus]|uniref:Hydroxyacylglutathione hydrolase n=1 Tax=Granulosicoccus antarcticus IMCC3135 TaxID=1192854 RepID=A0A2Z2NX81_9GAMM|nr:hydroxyacylglutathione hydrolase [Granulosicoccus antarcticus]ASJ75843.1 Hydroxyacylglutathione hydrolase [Granulosicoccus antarcticus IMCC3135]
MSKLECFQFPYGGDNYGVLVHDADTGQTACIDAGHAQAALDALDKQGWSLTHLLITHHHGDHTAGLAAIKSATGCQVTGPEPVSTAIAGLDQFVSQGSEFEFAGRAVKAIHTPGHTKDMINYYFADDELVFTGDTLFSMGCGRLFEGDAAMMLESVAKLKVLPPETLVYCAHEYTATNARFALDVDPSNAALQARAAEVTKLRDQGLATVPTKLQLELETNPFLRIDNSELRQALGMPDADEVAVFAELRERRNQY